jgi:hypothetical protein
MAPGKKWNASASGYAGDLDDCQQRCLSELRSLLPTIRERGSCDSDDDDALAVVDPASLDIWGISLSADPEDEQLTTLLLKFLRAREFIVTGGDYLKSTTEMLVNTLVRRGVRGRERAGIRKGGRRG